MKKYSRPPQSKKEHLRLIHDKTFLIEQINAQFGHIEAAYGHLKRMHKELHAINSRLLHSKYIMLEG